MSSVSYFKNAKNFVTSNTTFTTYVSGTDALQFLYKHSATGAMHDSDERYPPPMCHPGTREAIVARIADWYGYQTGPGKPIMWVHAPAGYGKTAIAGTVSKMLEEQKDLCFKPLGATFFFWRTSPDRNSPAAFIITIAYQLAISIPDLRPHVERVVETDPMILRKALEVQLDKLIVEPFSALGNTEGMPNLLVIVDGLDECINSEKESRVVKPYAEDQERVQLRILNLIHTLQSHHLPLSFLILSRPEPWIKQRFESTSFKDVVEVVDLYAVGDHLNDVERYVRAELSRIAACIEDKQEDEEWPGEDLVRIFVERTEGHMLYASTVVRHVDDPYSDPRQRLYDILHSSKPSPDLGHSAPFSSLYELYRQIMRSCPESHRPLMIEVLEDIHAARKTFKAGLKVQHALATLDRLSGRLPGQGLRALRVLHPVLCLDPHAVIRLDPPSLDPAEGGAGQGWLNFFYHSSFPEFLQNPHLSLEFSTKWRKGDQRLLRGCLNCLSTIASHSKVEEDYVRLALEEWPWFWRWAWEKDFVETEYFLSVKKLLAIDLTTCFIKAFTSVGNRLSRFTYFPIEIYRSGANSCIVPLSYTQILESERLVQQAVVHLRSSLEAAYVLLLSQACQDPTWVWNVKFTAGLLYSLEELQNCSTETKDWDANEVVRALKGFSHEQRERFDRLMQDVRGEGKWYHIGIEPILMYIHQGGVESGVV